MRHGWTQGGTWRHQEASWRPGLAAVPGRPPRRVRRLIGERGSLTERLEEIGPVSVDVLCEGWQRPSADEAVALGLTPRRRVWLREVILACHGGPRVFARSVVPGRPAGALASLPRLGAQPLGRLIFAGGGVRRGPVAVARLNGHERLAQRLLNHGCSAAVGSWARRSILHTAGQSLLVTEVFLPATTSVKGDRAREWSSR